MEATTTFWVDQRGWSGVDTRSRVVEYHRRSKYRPHQGKQEMERRKR